MIPTASVCAVILAGGQGTRMGGLDKGLQMFRGQPLVANALDRLHQQTAGEPGLIAINANRNLPRYASLGVPVWSDTVPDYAGPLAGWLAALQQSKDQYEFLLSVPCDSPLFPLDLLQRLWDGLHAENVDIAMALALDTEDGGSAVMRPQPVFCLLRTSLAASLQKFVESGGRKIGAWTASQRQTKVAFCLAEDEPRAFANANTLADLHHLEKP